MTDDFTTLATSANIAEADLLANALQGHGFDVRVIDSATVQNAWLFGSAVGGIRIQVPDAQAADARELMSDLHFEADPQKLCPQCQSADFAYERISRKWTFISILCLGFPFLFIGGRMHCRSCGHDWKPQP